MSVTRSLNTICLPECSHWNAEVRFVLPDRSSHLGEASCDIFVVRGFAVTFSVFRIHAYPVPAVVVNILMFTLQIIIIFMLLL